jgi:hypothetical protein
MKSVQHYRAMASICRQRAVFDPQHSWKHLGDAERWEHLAHAEIANRFEECNAAVGAPTGASPSSASKEYELGHGRGGVRVNKNIVTSAT